MSLTRVTAGSEASIDDLNQLIDLLQGTSGYTETFLLRCATSTDFKVRLSDASGARKFIVQDSAGTDVAYVDSDGNLTILGAFTPGTLILPTATSPSQTTEGSVSWDSDDDLPTFGTGAATKYIGLSRGAGSDASAVRELMYDTTNTALKVWNGSASTIIAEGYKEAVFKHKSATQNIGDGGSGTTYTTITAASGNFAFDMAASEVWLAEYWLPLAFGGTGGAKFQLTGPAAPTGVNITGTWAHGESSGGAAVGGPLVSPFTAVTAFSSDIAAANSAGNLTSSNTYCNDGPGSFIHIRARIINGANAGTVTLQGAQNSANSTTTVGLGATMRAERIG